MLGMRLGLRYNSDANEAQDVGPSTPMPRSQVAFSLYKAETQPSWTVPCDRSSTKGSSSRR